MMVILRLDAKEKMGLRPVKQERCHRWVHAGIAAPQKRKPPQFPTHPGSC
jgi:hypothetical protein